MPNLLNQFPTHDDAIFWRENLTTDEEKYLRDVDKFVAKMQPDKIYNVDKLVKPQNLDNFYKCINYILIGTQLDISFSSDYLNFKLNDK